MPQMKCVSGQWLVQLHKYLEDNPQIIVHSFRHAGALGLLDEDDLPDHTTTDESNMDEAMYGKCSIQTLSIRCIYGLTNGRGNRA